MSHTLDAAYPSRQVYVRQEDIFFPQLTVREALMTAHMMHSS